MKRTPNLLARLLGIAVLATCASGASAASDYPNRPIHLIVPYAAGGTIDLMGRILGPKITTALGQPVIVENRPGAGTTLGADVVARSEPDGYTLFLGSNSAFTISPQIMSNVRYDPIRDFAAIGTLVTFPNLILVAPNSPYKTLADLIAASKTNKFSYASFGVGTTSELSGEAIKMASGANIAAIPYKSGAQCVQAILTGEVAFGFDTMIGSAQRVKAGQLRALATTSAKRVAELPDVPSIVEAGYPSAEVIGWVALFAPAKTPNTVRNKLSDTMQRIMADPEIKQRFADLGVEAIFEGEKATTAQLESEYARLGKLIKAANIRTN